jgi:hypothetical protein
MAEALLCGPDHEQKARANKTYFFVFFAAFFVAFFAVFFAGM